MISSYPHFEEFVIKTNQNFRVAHLINQEISASAHSKLTKPRRRDDFGDSRRVQASESEAKLLKNNK